MESASCIYCDEKLNPNAANVVRKITCWAENSKTGKPTKIIQPVDLQQYCHKLCWETKGVRATSLF